MDVIATLLQKLELENNITILYAVEAGSRSYGLDSDISDYDIRFIYKKNDIKSYITIGIPKDTIIDQQVINDIPYDYQGWDIIKATKHLQESNPSIIEWLYSPIIYIDKQSFKSKYRHVVEQMHTQTSLMYHYYNMARKNWNDWILNTDNVIFKKYFYVLRPLAMLIYFMKNKDVVMPLFQFDELIDIIKHNISQDVYDNIMILIQLKKGKHNKIYSANQCINKWILDIFDQFEKVTKAPKNDMGIEIDARMQSSITIYNKMENEVKKVVDITSKTGFTDRRNYLSAIGLVLQFVWLTQYPEKEVKHLPTKIHNLLKDVSYIDQQIFESIDHIVTYREMIKKDDKVEHCGDKSIGNVTYNYIYDTYVDPIVKHIMIIDGVSNIDDIKSLNKSTRTALLTFKEKPDREDIIEFIIRNQLHMLWLLGNKSDSQTHIPYDMINTSDPTNTIASDALKEFKKIITLLRPKYIVGKNEILHKWFKSVIDTYKPLINKSQQDLMHIREVTTEKRFKKSLNKLSLNVFDVLVSEFL